MSETSAQSPVIPPSPPTEQFQSSTVVPAPVAQQVATTIPTDTTSATTILPRSLNASPLALSPTPAGAASGTASNSTPAVASAPTPPPPPPAPVSSPAQPSSPAVAPTKPADVSTAHPAEKPAPPAPVRPNTAQLISHEATAHNDVHPPHAETPSSRIDLPAGAHPADLRPGVAVPVMPEISPDLAHKPTTEIRAGLPHKPFYIHTELLIKKSPYFAAMQNTPNNPQPSHRLSGPFFFPELDEFAFAHFVRWIYGGELHGPHDFHSMNHYLCLYVLALKFQIEKLKNTCMDLIRKYYAEDDMTAPPFRLDYIYQNTSENCLMREFLVSSAAFRSFAEAENGKDMSDSMRGVLYKEGDLGPDFAQALLDLIKSDRTDPRKGDACRWHDHDSTPKCKSWGGFEPWQSP